MLEEKRGPASGLVVLLEAGVTASGAGETNEVLCVVVEAEPTSAAVTTAVLNRPPPPKLASPKGKLPAPAPTPPLSAVTALAVGNASRNADKSGADAKFSPGGLKQAGADPGDDSPGCDGDRAACGTEA